MQFSHQLTRTMDAHAERRRAKDEADTAVARRLFIAGCFLLPWLWIVMLVHFRKRIFDKDAPPMLRKCELLVNSTACVCCPRSSLRTSP